MTSGARATLVLAATLLIGAAIGAFGVGAIAQQRRHQPPPPPPRGGGFIGHMERLIEPHDEAQREALLPFLQAVDVQNREIIDGAEGDMRAALEGMIQDVSSILDADQLERLQGALAGAPLLAPRPRGNEPGGTGRRPPGGPPPRR